jgi:hypothetical protein
MAPSIIGWFFLGLAIIFLAVAVRDHRRTRGAQSPARRAWLRIAIIFGLVGATLQFGHLM